MALDQLTAGRYARAESHGCQPDAFGFVLVGTFVVLLFGLVTGEPLLERPDVPTATKGYGLVDAWGLGFWSLITFTLQMAMIIIGGYAVATSGPVARRTRADARWPPGALRS